MSRITDWREDAGLSKKEEYLRKFAYFPKRSSDGEIIWLSHYYKHYRVWVYDMPKYPYELKYKTATFVENITEKEYVFRKLSETL